jgi:hypothetical protein
VFNMPSVMDYERESRETEGRRQELERRTVQIRFELARLKEELAGAERELRGLDHIRTGIEIAVGLRESAQSPAPGLTAHIRSILVGTRVALTAREITNACQALGIQGSSPRNLTIQVHTTLRRMGSNLKASRKNGRLAYLPGPGLRGNSAQHPE